RDRRDLCRDHHGPLRRAHQDRGGRPGPAALGRAADDARRGAGDARSARHRRTARRSATAPDRVILADTSAWVEYDRATGSAVDRRLAELIEAAGPLAVTEPVVMEVLAGARDDRRATDLRRLLMRFELLSF